MLLQRGITAARSGRTDEAQKALRQVIELDPHNEMAWLWLSSLTESIEGKRNCLEQVLQTNPGNVYARAGLARLGQTPQAETDPLEARLQAVTVGGVPESQSAFPPEEAEPARPGNGKPLDLKSPAPANSSNLTCPMCDRPIAPGAKKCPYCYLPLKSLQELLGSNGKAKPPAPPPPPKRNKRRGLLSYLLPGTTA